MPSPEFVTDARAEFPYRLPADLPAGEVAQLRERVVAAAERSQYGWGHTIDFGPFTQPGLLGDKYLQMAGLLDSWGWWPADLAGRRVADVGCFTGGLSMVLAARGAATVYAVDELPDHLEQCRIVADAFGVGNVTPVQASLYALEGSVEPGSLDVVLMAGVLYHLSDMLVGLMTCQRLLAPGGVLIVESNAVECFDHSYANFGRYFEGMWWQPTARCLLDLAGYSGFADADVRFYKPGRALARMVRAPGAEIPFKRGVNLPFADLRDAVERTRDPAVMLPAPDFHAQGALLRRVASGAGERAYRRTLSAGYRAVRAARARRRHS